MAEIESREEISVSIKRDEAEALAHVAQTGLSASEALKLITNSGAADRALNGLRGARGRSEVTGALKQPEGAALVAISEGRAQRHQGDPGARRSRRRGRFGRNSPLPPCREADAGERLFGWKRVIGPGVASRLGHVSLAACASA